MKNKRNKNKSNKVRLHQTENIMHSKKITKSDQTQPRLQEKTFANEYLTKNNFVIYHGFILLNRNSL